MSEIELLKGTDIAEFGVIYKENVLLRSSPYENSDITAKLPFNKRVYIHRELPYNWYFVITEDNLSGFIPTWVVKKNLPEPFARLHKIKEGESAIGIAEQYFKDRSQNWGADLRFYINVLVYANDGDGNLGKGIYREFGKDWKEVKTRAGYYIWIPSIDFAEKLKGFVKSGSITYGLWDLSKKALNELWDFVKFGSAFIAGLIHGFLESLWDTLAGIWEAANMFWSLIKSIFTLNIISNAKALFEKLLNLNYMEIIENWIKDFESKWNHEDALKRGHFRGWVMGYAIAEILMNFFSFGGTIVAKLSGKVAKIAKVLMEVQAVKSLLANSIKVIEKITPLLKETSIYNKAKITVLLGNDALKVLEEVGFKYGDYILKDLGLTSVEGKMAIIRVIGNPTYERIEKFMRQSQQFLSEIGKSKTGKVLGWSVEEISDKGFKGKVFELLVNKFGKEAIEDLNKINKNFPVVDIISKDKGYIISIGRGRPDYLWDKIQVLFNVEITASGHVSANLNKFDKMMNLLKKNNKVKDLVDFENKARLLVPDDVVMPLKAMIMSRVKEEQLRLRMINAIISEI